MSQTRGRKLARVGAARSRSRSSSSLFSGERMNTSVYGGGRAPSSYGKRVQNPYFNPLPNILKSQLRYVEHVTILIPEESEAAIPYYFSCNGLEDPNVTGTGHKPYFYSTLNKLYQHYRVDKSVCTIKPLDVIPNLIYGCNVTSEIVPVPMPDNIECERKMHNYKVISTDTVPPDNKVVTKWSLAGSFPLTSREDMNAAYGSMPVEQMYFQTWVRRAPGGDSSVSVSFLVEIDFWVSSYELVQLTG